MLENKESKICTSLEKIDNSKLETLYILSIPGMEDAILEAANEPIENSKTDIEWE